MTDLFGRGVLLSGLAYKFVIGCHVKKISEVMLIATIFLLTGLALGQYSDMQELTGQFDVSGKYVIDPLPGDPSDTHFRFYLTGESAKTLFEHMDVEPSTIVCGEPEGPVKKIGSMNCVGSPQADGYQCFFAIDIANQKIEGGWAC